MKKLLAIIAAILLVPFLASATPVTWDFTGTVLQPLQSAYSAVIKGAYFQATSTTASAFPYASTTQLSASGSLCINGDCRTVWPSSTASGLATTSPISAGNLLEYKASGGGSAFGIATSSETCTSPLSCGAHDVLTGGGAISIQAASASQAGSMAAVDYQRLYTATTTFSAPLVYTLSTNAVTCTNASSGVTGCMSAADWGLLHTATTTFTYPLTYTSSTNAVTFPATSTLYGTGTAGQVLMWSGSAPIWAATSTASSASSTLLTDNNTFSGTTTMTKALQLGTTAGDHQIIITPSRLYSASVTAGGAMLLDNTLNDGAGLVLSTNHAGSATGRLFTVDCRNAAFDQNCVNIQGIGTQSIFNLQGAAPGLGTEKISDLNGASSSNSSALLSADATVGSFQGQGIFTKCNAATTTFCYVARDGSSNLLWGVDGNGLSTLINSSTTQATISGKTWLTSLATPAGTFLATDPNGLIIATTTPVSGSASTTLLTDNNTFGGTQTFNNLTVNGTCTGCGTGSGVWPFTPATNFGTSTQSTTTPEWFTTGVYASSTSQFDNASTSLLSLLNLSNTQLPFVSSGVLSGSNDLEWNNGTKVFSIAGSADQTSEIDTGGRLNVRLGGDGEGFEVLPSNGTSAGSTGGFVGLYAGNASTTALGGFVEIFAGNGSTNTSNGTGNGGYVTLQSGSGGKSGNTNGGNILLAAGVKHGSGTDGVVRIFSNGGTNDAQLDTSPLNADRTFSFQNWSGTFAIATGTLEAPAFVATSTLASILPYASSTAISATTFYGTLVGNADTATQVGHSLSPDGSTLTGTAFNGSATVSNWALNLSHGNSWTALQNFYNNASTSQLTATSSVWFTGITNGLISADANGLLSASSSVGANFITGTLGNVNTNSPLGGGGALTRGGTLSLTCSTCVTTSRNVNTTFPLQGGGALSGDLTLTNAFGTTTNTGLTANQFVYTSPSGVLITAASSSLSLPNSALQNSSISGVALGSNLAALTNDATLNGSSYNGSAAISDWGLNLANANGWTALQNFYNNASTSQFTATSSVWFTSLGTPAGTFLAVDPNGLLIATTTPTSGSASTTLLTDNNTFSGTTTFPGGIWNGSGGKVGIGTSTPADLLHINTAGSGVQDVLDLTSSIGQASEEPRLVLGTTQGGASATIRSFGGISATGGTSFANSLLKFWVDNGSGTLTNYATIDHNGNFGIATSSPWKKLSVAGDIIGTNLTATGTLSVSGQTSLAGASTTMITSSGATWFTGVTASRPLYVDSNGLLGSAGSGTSGNCVQWGANNTLGDAGSACGTGGGAWPWTMLTNFATTTDATTTPAWFKLGLFASSTSQFDYASTTAMTIGNVGTAIVSAVSGFLQSLSLSPFFSLSGNTLSAQETQSFSYASTTFLGTTTRMLKIMNESETLASSRCKVQPSGEFINVQFGKLTASTTMINASSTANKVVYSSNNTFSAGDTLALEMGTTTSLASVQLTCSLNFTI